MTTNDQAGVTIGFNIGNQNTLYQYFSNTPPGLFADMQALGLGWVRLNYSWRNIERTNGTYTWTVLDDAVKQINGSGYKLLFCIRGAPDWALVNTAQKASSEPWYMPDPTLWAGFTTAVLTRYNGGTNGRIDAIGYNEDWNIHFTSSTDILTLNSTITNGGGPYTTLTVTAASQTADIGTKIYLGGYANATDVATVSTAVAAGDTTVHINSFTPAVTYASGVNMHVAYVKKAHSSTYNLYNSGAAGTTGAKGQHGQASRDPYFAAAVHNAMAPAVRAISSTMPIGLPLMWWTQPANANLYTDSPPTSNYTAFLSTLYDLCGSNIDANTFVDFHYYSNTIDPTTGSGTVSTIQQAIADLQAVSSAKGDSGRAIWMTEFGWQIPQDVANDAIQSARYKAVMNAIIPPGNPNKNKFFFFTLYYAQTGGTGGSLVYWDSGSSTYKYRQAYYDVQAFLAANPSGGGGGSANFVVQPRGLTYAATPGGSNPSSQTVTITNNAATGVSYTATSGASWLSVSPASGAIAANGGTATSTISVNIAGLTLATYVGTITYNNGSVNATVTVTLNLGISGGGGRPATPPYSVLLGGASHFVEAGSLSMDSAIARRSMAYATVHQQDTTTHFQQDEQVQIVGSNGVTAFSGYIAQPQESKPGFSASLDHQIQFADQHRLADKRIMARSYIGKSASFIVQDIVNTYLSAEGVTIGQLFDGPIPSTTLYPATTLYPNGSDSIIPQAVFAYCSVADALDALATATTTSGIPYYWQIDQNKKLFFVPYTAIVNSTAIDGTLIDNGIASGTPPKVMRANPTYRNGQYIVGGVALTVPATQLMYGNGNTNYTLNFAVNSITSIVLNGGTAKTFGVKGVDTGKNYYYAVGDPVIAADASEPVLASTDYLTFYYTGQYPSVYYSQNAGQVAFEQGLDGTSGIVENVIQDSTIVGATQGFARAAQLLARYATTGVQFVFNTLQSRYQPGQMVTVSYGPFGFSNTQMLVESVSASDAHDGVNLWYTLSLIAGPYDTNWVSFFSNLVKQAQNANANINVGISSSVSVLATFATPVSVGATMTVSLFNVPAPSTTLFPSTTLYTG